MTSGLSHGGVIFPFVPEFFITTLILSRGICHGKIYQRPDLRRGFKIARPLPWHYDHPNLRSRRHHRPAFAVASSLMPALYYCPDFRRGYYCPDFHRGIIIARPSTWHHYHPRLCCIATVSMYIYSARSIPGEEFMVPELFSQLHLAIKSLNLSSFQNSITLTFIIHVVTLMAASFFAQVI